MTGPRLPIAPKLQLRGFVGLKNGMSPEPPRPPHVPTRSHTRRRLPTSKGPQPKASSGLGAGP